MRIYCFIVIVVLSQIGFSGSRVTMALHALQLDAGQVAIGVMAALYSLGPLFLAIPMGRLTDRISLRLPMMIGLTVMAVFLLMPVRAGGIGLLFLTALLVGIGHQLYSLPLEVAVGGVDGEENRSRNYAFVTMAWSAGNSLGPLVAGLAIDHLGQQQVYFLLAAFTGLPVLILLLGRTLLPNTRSKHKEDGPRGGVLELWRIRPVRMTIIASGVVGTGLDLFQFYMPIYGHSLGLSASAIGTILGTVFIAAFTIRSVLPLLVKKFDEARIMVGAIFFTAAAYALFPFFANPYALGAIAFLLGLGVGCAQPMAMSLLYALTPQGRTAEAFGMHRTVRNATHLVVPVVFGGMGSAFGYLPVFLSNAFMLLGSGLLMRKAGIRTDKAEVGSRKAEV